MDFLGKYPFFFDLKVVAAQMACFGVFFFLMKTFLFDRVLAFLRDRERRLEQAAQGIATAREELERRAKLYAEAMAAADKAAYEAMQDVVRKGQQERARTIAAAHDHARQEIQYAKADLAEEKKSALTRLDADIAALSEDILRTVTT